MPTLPYSAVIYYTLTYILLYKYYIFYIIVWLNYFYVQKLRARTIYSLS